MESKYSEGNEEKSYKGDGGVDHKGVERDAKSALDADYLVTQLEKFFYEDTELARTFEDYVKEKSVMIDLDSEEYGLAYTEAHNEYKHMFETKMEAEIMRLGATPIEFYDALQQKMADDPNGHVALFAQILLAVTEFDIFMTMMKEAARTFHSDRK